jgi:hypothetical protein
VADLTGVLGLIDGVEIAAETAGEGATTFVIRAAGLAVGRHYLTIIGIHNGTARSTEIAFTVIAAVPEVVPEIEVNGADALKSALLLLEENTPANPYRVKMSGIALKNTGDSLNAMYDALSRYVDLDLRLCIGSPYAAVGSDGKSYIVSVTLGEDISAIADGAFANCTALERVKLDRSVPPSLGAGVFPSGPPFAAIIVPRGAGAAYRDVTQPNWTVELKNLIREE